MSVRVYVPTTLTALAGFVGDGGIGPAPVRARAVTAWLREAWPEGDEEEWEYAALMAAADDSAALLTDEDPPRRVVAGRRGGLRRRRATTPAWWRSTPRSR